MNWSDRASSSPSMRAKLAKGIREATRPGPKRLALLAGIGEPALPGDSAPPVAPVVVKPKRRTPARSRAVNDWKAWAATRRPEAVGNSRLVLWLPGLVLRSENKAQRSNHVRGKGWTNLEANAATNEAREAWRRNDQPLWRFTVPVVIRVWQVRALSQIDPGNLYKKALIDTLQTRTGGVGIIQDDARRYVVSESTGYATGATVGVIVEIEPATVPEAASILERR